MPSKPQNNTQGFLPTTFEKLLVLYVGISAAFVFLKIISNDGDRLIRRALSFHFGDEDFWLALFIFTVLPAAIWIAFKIIRSSGSTRDDWLTLEIEARKAKLRSQIAEHREKG